MQSLDREVVEVLLRKRKWEQRRGSEETGSRVSRKGWDLVRLLENGR